MILSSDSERYIATLDIHGKKINKNILQKIEDDLDIDEKISILFLTMDNYTCGFQEIYDLLQEHKMQKSHILSKFFDKYPINWENKLLEAICIIQNKQIIQKLGLSFSILELLYLPKNRLCSRHLNSVGKCLYLLCEALTVDRIQLLLQNVKKDLIEYEKDLKDIDYLELHMLYWMQQKYISIHSDGKVSLYNLLKHLKRMDDLELIYEDLKYCENHQNVFDIKKTNLSSTSRLETFSTKEVVQMLPNNEKGIYKMKTGLCIIISQMLFLGQKFETRFGTTADSNKLLETFKGFGFTVKIFNNLKKYEILENLKNIPNEFGTDYDCIFVCILSHGYKGGIISSDEEEVSCETIENYICCNELKDVIKIVIVQACQGQATGQANDSLTIDDSGNYNISNILAHQNFCIFMSTMQGFISVRHKAEGSWFIQEFCNVLQDQGHRLTFLNAVNKIIQTVIQKRGTLNGTDSIAQLPELRPYRLLTDFQLPEYRMHNRFIVEKVNLCGQLSLVRSYRMIL
ncbi:caspase-8 Dredd isoform X2 [Ptiloglossa arizonensis]|uniref:caspase-8 Dredd isoform X2 n=1 Tax=Ptiloglossa arizonensis TaxID=3350558 RepID=UPI003FA12196